MTIEQIIDWKKTGAAIFWDWNSYTDQEIEAFKKDLMLVSLIETIWV